LINPVRSGQIGQKMQTNRFGVILEARISKRLFTLAKENKQTPYEYLKSTIDEKYQIYLKEKLNWDSDYE
jgi:hypothetical protein